MRNEKSGKRSANQNAYPGEKITQVNKLTQSSKTKL